jgi:hypothetical protein
MRGYLAARHLVAAANPLGVLRASETDWPEAGSEQDLVWGFLAALADRALAAEIYAWSL